MKKIALLLLYYFQNFICSYKQQVVHRVFYLMESFALLYLQLEDHSETFAQFMQTMTQRKQTPAKEQGFYLLSFPQNERKTYKLRQFTPCWSVLVLICT